MLISHFGSQVGLGKHVANRYRKIRWLFIASMPLFMLIIIYQLDAGLIWCVILRRHVQPRAIPGGGDGMGQQGHGPAMALGDLAIAWPGGGMARWWCMMRRWHRTLRRGGVARGS